MTKDFGGRMSIEEQLAMCGAGWDGDLDAMRVDRFAAWDAGPDVDTSG